MNGIPCNIKKINELASKYTRLTGNYIWIVSDTCRSLGAKLDNHNLSFFSDFSIYSFQAKKHLTFLGEGGGIVVKDPLFLNRLKMARQFGDKVSYGFNYKISLSQVLFGLVALEHVSNQIQKRINLGANRDLVIKSYPVLTNLYPTQVEYRCTYYLYTICVLDKEEVGLRDLIIHSLSNKNIGCCIANKPTYEVSPFISQKINTKNFPNAEYLSRNILSISLHPSFTEHDEDYILSSLAEVLKEYV